MEETRKLVALIEDMMISASKRFVALRLKRENLPMTERAHIHEEMQRITTTLHNLAYLRASVLETRCSGIDHPAVFRDRTRAVVRDELKLHVAALGG